MTAYVVAGIALQLAMVVAGHYSETVINLSAVLGTGIPFVLGAAFGARSATTMRGALVGGLAIGFVGALIGILAAILMGDQTWLLLAFGPASSAVIGMLGSVSLFALAGRRRTATTA